MWIISRLITYIDQLNTALYSVKINREDRLKILCLVWSNARNETPTLNGLKDVHTFTFQRSTKFLRLVITLLLSCWLMIISHTLQTTTYYSIQLHPVSKTEQNLSKNRYKLSISTNSKPHTMPCTYKASQMICFTTQFNQNKTFEKPCTRHFMSLWMSKNRVSILYRICWYILSNCLLFRIF